ncbi:MAG: hypothetical protein AB7V26_04615 [Lysobacterales bacterium]
MSELISRIEETIQSMPAAPATFDTHDFIRVLAHNHQQAYVDALHETEGDRPFQQLHAEIGRRLKTLKEYVVEREANRPSPDVFGNMSGCSVWERRR